ncbi:MAG: hypothetical protein NXI24_02545 [bacterium]|nr:hypothetical protein [bacterium]
MSEEISAGPAVGDLVSVRAQKWVQQGFCLGYLDAPRPESENKQGFPIFLHGALPGEDVQARVTRSNNRHCFGLVEKVEQPAPERLQSDCAVFPRCGGCSFRHIDYQSEVELKLRLIAEFQSLQNCIDIARERDQFQVHSGEPNGYRTRARLHRETKTTPPGFYELHSNRIVPLPGDAGCRQLAPDLNAAILEEIKEISEANASSDANSDARAKDDSAANETATTGDDGSPNERASAASATTGSADTKANDRAKRSANPRHHVLQLDLDDPVEVDGRPWTIPGGAFFQANQFLLSDWLQAARRMLGDRDSRGAPTAAKDSESDGARPATLELFCGSGLLGGNMRDLLGDYLGYDNAPTGLKAARGNFKRRGYEGRFENTDLYRRPVPVPRGTGLALINPPRAGMNQKQIPLLAEAGVGTILYSSCNPATLNRDLGKFLERGYVAQAVEVFDFFPRTPHLEVLILLERES